MIRAAGEADVPEILAIYAPYVLNTTVSFEYEVPSPADFLQRFRDVTAQYPWLVYEEEGRILGYAYASAPYTRAAYAWCAEPSIYLRPEARGRGIGKNLYSVLEAILARQGYRNLYALITEENTSSIRFHEKMGYIHRVNFPECGFKFGRWLGLNWLEKRLDIVNFPSTPPTSWLTFMQDDNLVFHNLDNFPLS